MTLLVDTYYKKIKGFSIETYFLIKLCQNEMATKIICNKLYTNNFTL